MRLSVCRPRSLTCCQFVVLINMLSAVLTDGEALGWFPSKGVINRIWAAASALTPCRGCLLGPGAEDGAFPSHLVTPVPSHDLSLQANTHPMRRQSNQYPSSIQPHPAQPCLIPFFLCPNTLQLQLSDSFAEWYRCRRPHHCPPLYQSALFTFFYR